MTNTHQWLHTIEQTSLLLHDIVEGRAVSVADLHKAAAVCGWITDYESADWDLWGRFIGDYKAHGICFEVGIEDDKGAALAVEYKEDEIVNGFQFTGATSQELADVGLAFLNAAIAVMHLEEKRGENA